MSLWGSSTTAESRPKFLPLDSNASGSMGAREDAIAVAGGWGLTPGTAASGNDNKAAQPEVLVCIRNLAAIRGTATVVGIDFDQGAVGNVGTFDVRITFDEAVDVTSAAFSADQVITNKAYILLSRLGVTDMVEDSTIGAMYFSGSGTNEITFRGTAVTNAAAGFIGLNGSGVGDGVTAGEAGIVFDGSADMSEEDGESVLAMRQEGGTAAAPAGRIVLDSAAAVVATVDGAITTATTALVLDGNSGTIAVGMKVYGQDEATPLTDAQGSTALSQDGSLTVAATNGSTSVTLNTAVTVANNIILNFSADGHDSVQGESIDFILEGVDGSTDVTGIPFTGGDVDVNIALEGDTDEHQGGRLVQDTAANVDEPFDVEDRTSDIAFYSQAGTSTGSAYVLNGVTVTAA
jgi:hypothetical protein